MFDVSYGTLSIFDTPGALDTAGTTQNDSADPRADINADGIVDLLDLSLVATQWQQSGPPGTLMSDVNDDGVVDVVDLSTVATNWQKTVIVEPPPPVVVYDWHQETIDGVLHVWAPNPSDFGTTFSVTDPNALFGPDGIPQIEGVRQGPTADCYFLAAGAGIAYSNPDRIMAIVRNDPGGGWAVTFRYWSSTLDRYTPAIIHTSSELSVRLQKVVNDEVWSLVLEKAYCAIRTWNGTTAVNTMESIGWGFGGTALTALNTPYRNLYVYAKTEEWIYSALQTALAAHETILFHTSSAATTMVVSHVYVITGASVDSTGTRWITTYNPWGFFETRTQSSVMLNSTGTILLGAA